MGSPWVLRALLPVDDMAVSVAETTVPTTLAMELI